LFFELVTANKRVPFELANKNRISKKKTSLLDPNELNKKILVNSIKGQVNRIEKYNCERGIPLSVEVKSYSVFKIYQLDFKTVIPLSEEVELRKKDRI